MNTPTPILPNVRDLAFDHGAMRYDASLIASPGAWLFDATDDRLGASAVSEGGRQAAWFVEGGFGAAVLRRYRRGGLVAHLSADRYIWTGEHSTRSFAEFDLLHFMHRQGLPVPRPLAASYWRKGAGYRAAILVQRLMDTRPLAQILDEANPHDVATAIFAVHEAGIWHADLNAYNILLDPQGKAWLIDFDKGRLHPLLSAERRRGNLLRLRRSLVKVGGEQGMLWWEDLNRAYGLLVKAAQHL
ncbi:3-deoxy-D-manno-octulosonic acid kinase [Allopusillimonas ginsengisoli]|uniref:3-deoxy-D-manno-octulosonic acid kinase n=1 Tax=Allopusillimonas ginsengisoli TaxID=453575 RepID=UPI0010219538|nr:3-deoxy-D-manno-octulosonic acid kinase [Allopusillimonas ginsengisoli]TEA78400.1 3-deoxy-D-manno-octulosonic acid kinase [Allopusillimonas ginsengisoli]